MKFRIIKIIPWRKLIIIKEQDFWVHVKHFFSSMRLITTCCCCFTFCPLCNSFITVDLPLKKLKFVSLSLIHFTAIIICNLYLTAATPTTKRRRRHTEGSNERNFHRKKSWINLLRECLSMSLLRNNNNNAQRIS